MNSTVKGVLGNLLGKALTKYSMIPWVFIKNEKFVRKTIRSENYLQECGGRLCPAAAVGLT